ncbi:MAG: hypothetical protein U1E40_07720 [Amaricoccus sp.]
MSAPARHGATPVGRLAELPPLERQVIRCMRLWCTAPQAPDRLRRELAARRGSAAAEGIAADFGDLMLAVARHARRPMLHHDPDCPCAGADECVFARFVALAAEGAREDAVLMAALMVRADIALPLATLAESIGLELVRGMAPRIVQ